MSALIRHLQNHLAEAIKSAILSSYQTVALPHGVNWTNCAHCPLRDLRAGHQCDLITIRYVLTAYL